MMESGKILFLVTEDWYFCSHRLQLAVGLKAQGYDVAVATRVSNCQKKIESNGIKLIPLQYMSRSSVNPIIELLSLWELFKIYRQEKPNLVHQVAIKPVIYGSIAAYLAKIPFKVNALGGLGFVFSSPSFILKFIRPLLLAVFRLIFNDRSNRLILQNKDDLKLLVNRAQVVYDNIRLISGAGVDLKVFGASSLPTNDLPIVMMASRMLWAKGVKEFVTAASLIKKQGISARFVLVGIPDPSNPDSLSEKQLHEWHNLGDIEWWGHQDKMQENLAQATIVSLPSYYGEGIPKVLIEAMACARPIVTTNMPGCRELVKSNKNGLLVKPRDSEDLARALKILLLDKKKCFQMGLEGRRIAEDAYSLEMVISQTLEIYDELLKIDKLEAKKRLRK